MTARSRACSSFRKPGGCGATGCAPTARSRQASLDALRAGITVDGIHYGPIEAALERVQGTNLWLTFAIREGKHREVRHVLGDLGLVVTRLIRVSFGPFQLGELAAGAVEEVRTRVLREQLGARLVARSGADFSTPPAPPPPPEKPPRPEKKERAHASDSPKGARDRSTSHTWRANDRPGKKLRPGKKERAPASNSPKGTRHRSTSHSWRASEEDRPGKKLRRKFRGLRRDDGKPREAPTAEPRTALLTDRKGRRVLVERFGQTHARSGTCGAQGTPSAAALSGATPAAAARPLMRVVGGRLRGRSLAAPKTQAIRPTADRLRESLFNILLHAYGDPIAGARVLDLFAGTGALGIEAASRGAAFVLFIDESAEARALLRENVAALGLGGASRIFRRDATKLGPVHPLPPFSLVFVDPPYGQDLASEALASARAGGWFTADALIVVEEATKSQFAAPEGFTELERRRYDDTEFVFLRSASSA